ncbi:MAG: phospho-N-acetylmuramoyl-pentapeptide-transferase, partial [Spirochaetaceae bacterium]|nr:phospho-N-acetylmuramoyl-pentapeptide-transferase [Spirochaetaceae bacterium]
MLYFIGEALESFFGPFRLFTSHLFLIVAGTAASFLATFILLPRLFPVLPTDRGRTFAVDGHMAKGKPTGAGVVFISVFTLVAVLVVPWGWRQLSVLALTFAAMMGGFLDDRAESPWGEYVKGLMDLAISIVAAFILYSKANHIWLPFTTVQFSMSIYVFVPIVTILIWVTINSTNCTDGVDGLSSTLV